MMVSESIPHGVSLSYDAIIDFAGTNLPLMGIALQQLNELGTTDTNTLSDFLLSRILDKIPIVHIDEREVAGYWFVEASRMESFLENNEVYQSSIFTLDQYREKYSSWEV